MRIEVLSGMIASGKCLASDTMVVDARTGDWLTIREFVEEGRGETATLHGFTKVARSSVSASSPSGSLPVYRVESRQGLSVRATANHPFLTWDGWKELGELSPGDRIASARSIPVFGESDELSDAEVTFLALMLADGQCEARGSSPAYTKFDDVMQDRMKACCREIGFETSRSREGRTLIVNRQGRGGIMTKNRANIFLERMGCACLSVEKHIPAAIFRLRRDRVALFLSTLFSGDGSAYVSKAGQLLVEYSSTSPWLARGVRHLLLRFGVYSSIHGNPSASGKTAYKILISNWGQLRRFASEIGFLTGSYKGTILSDALAGRLDDGRTNYDTLPHTAWVEAQMVMDRHDVRWSRYNLCPQRDQSMGLWLARAIADDTDDTDWSRRAYADVVWEKVKSIRPDGNEMTYDVTVPETSCFIADDFIVHNSTYARKRAKEGALCVTHDDMTAMLHCEYRYEQGLRESYRRMEEAIVTEAIRAGRDALVDRTHLTLDSRRRWIDFAHRLRNEALIEGDREIYRGLSVIAVAFPVEAPEVHARRRFESDPRGRSYDEWLFVARHHWAQAQAEPLSEDEGFAEIMRMEANR